MSVWVIRIPKEHRHLSCILATEADAYAFVVSQDAPENYQVEEWAVCTFDGESESRLKSVDGTGVTEYQIRNTGEDIK